VSLGPFFYFKTAYQVSERAKAGKPAGAKPRIYGLQAAIREDGREEGARAAGLPKSCFGVLQPSSSTLKAMAFCLARVGL
jgi:hypothetical protein